MLGQRIIELDLIQVRGQMNFAGEYKLRHDTKQFSFFF